MEYLKNIVNFTMSTNINDMIIDTERLQTPANYARSVNKSPNAELIYLIHKHVQAQGGKGTIDDIVTIKCNWKKKWDDYAKTTSSQT